MITTPIFRAVVLSASLIFIAGASRAQQAATPSPLAALLPTIRDVKGLQIKITEAGFGEIRGDGSFYFSYDVMGPEGKWDAETLDKSVNLTRLFAPDGTPLMNTGSQNKRIYSSEVSPLWPSVRAEFEVRDPARPIAATGRALSHRKFQITELPPLPAAENQETTGQLVLEWKTARGSQLKLEKLTRRKSGSDSDLTVAWKFAPPTDIPEVEARFENVRAIYLDAGGKKIGEENTAHFDANEKGEIELGLNNVPNQTRGVDFSFELIESARRWRASDASERVSFEIPVAALWKIAPLSVRPPAVAGVKARNESFEASWEMREPDYDDKPQARLWVRDLAPSPDGEIWTLKSKDAILPQKDGQTRSLFGSTQGWNSVFHSDNSLREASESWVSFPLYRPENLDDKADVAVTAQRARTILKTHVLPLVPLPKRNDSIEFGPKEVFDGHWYLRRITWVDDERLKDNLMFSGGAGLLLTFDLAPGDYLAESQMQLERTVFYDEKGEVDNNSSTFDEGDPAETGHDTDRITMILSPPEASSEKFGGNFQIFQRVWSGPTKTLVLPGVPLTAQTKERG